MLIERAKVTLQAMLWSTWLEQQGTLEEAKLAAANGQANLSPAPQVSFEDVFGASLGKERNLFSCFWS